MVVKGILFLLIMVVRFYTKRKVVVLLFVSNPSRGLLCGDTYQYKDN